MTDSSVFTTNALIFSLYANNDEQMPPPQLNIATLDSADASKGARTNTRVWLSRVRCTLSSGLSIYKDVHSYSWEQFLKGNYRL